MMSPGDTFLIPTPPYYNVSHLFIVLAVQESSQMALIVNITSERLCEGTCPLNVGDHPFITHPSVIDYAHARIQKISNLEKSLKNEVIKSRQPVNKDLLLRIQKGALDSPAISQKCQNFLLKNFKKEPENQ
jgi:hypothetical protein